MVLFLCVFPYSYLISALVFVIASLTDFFDGYLARKLKQITTIGKLLDPIADKVLVICMLLLVIDKDVIPTPYGIIAATIVISREFVIGAFRQIAASSNLILAADKLGKFKTLLQYLSVPLLIISVKEANPIFNLPTCYTAVAIFSLSVLMTVVSAINYIVQNKVILKQNESSKDNTIIK
jgi:CDP-diacylglycerol--glycerol-3-phosphate 3-phosphatidyltransferase